MGPEAPAKRFPDPLMQSNLSNKRMLIEPYCGGSDPKWRNLVGMNEGECHILIA